MTFTFSEPPYICTNPALTCDDASNPASGLRAFDAALDFGPGKAVDLIDVTGGGTSLTAAGATATWDGTTFVVTLPANAATGLALQAANSYKLVINTCGSNLGESPCANGVVDNLGGALGDSLGNAATEVGTVGQFALTFSTANPVQITSANTTASWLTPAQNLCTQPALAICPLPTARRDVGAASVGGKFYVTGGQDAVGTIVSTSQVYNPATNQWLNTSSLRTARYAHAAVEANGKLYVIGGAASAGTLSSVEVFTPGATLGTGSWASGPSLPAVRRYAAAAVVYQADASGNPLPGTGTIYVAGGVDGSGTAQKTLYRLSPGASSWVTVTTAPLPNYHTKFTLSVSGVGSTARLWAVGGPGVLGDIVDMFDPNTSTWAAVGSAPTLPAQRSLHGAAVYDGYLYVAGGLDTLGAVRSEVYYLDVAGYLANPGLTWQTAPALPSPEGRAAFGGQLAVLDSALSPNRTGIMIAGGRTASSAATSVVVAAEHN